MREKNNKLKFIFSIFLFFGFFSFAKNSWAATYTANSCSLADVQTAIGKAVHGDTVNVPAGSCTWNAPLTMAKAIKLIGPGPSKLTITADFTCMLNTYDGCEACRLIRFPIATEAALITGKTIRISGFTFNANKKAGFLYLENKDHNYPYSIRIDNNVVIDALNYVQTSGGRYVHNIDIYGYVYGVIDSNNFYCTGVCSSWTCYNCGDTNGLNVGVKPSMAIGGAVENNEFCGAFRAHAKYDPGGATNLYIENNAFTYNGNGEIEFTHANVGAKVVYRYNTFTSNSKQYDAAMIYIHQSDAKPGALGVEIYGNEFIQPYGDLNGNYSVSHSLYTQFSSPLLAFSNKSTTLVSDGSATLSYSIEACKPPETYTWYRQATAVGNGGEDTIINTESTATAYRPCAPVGCAANGTCGLSLCPSSMIGSYDEYLYAGTKTCSAGPDVTAQIPAHPWRTYHFQNRYSPVSGISGNLTPFRYHRELMCGNWDSDLDHQPLENVHWFKDNSACTALSCSAGIGCGSVKPTGTCAKGTAYWQTSQSCSQLTSGTFGASANTPIIGTLYRCVSTNIWQAYYTPYTYPHPLRAGTANTVPAAPTGVKVI